MNSGIFIAIVALGILIFFHELGHFLVARLFGVGVEKFSLGFGPRLIGKTIGRTNYRLSAIPLGGYVKMVGEEPDAAIDPADIPFSFTHKHVIKRMLIVAAGPLFNLILAVLIFFGFYLFAGIEDVTPQIRRIDAAGPAGQAGVRLDDVIVSIDGVATESWYDIHKAVERSGGKSLDLRIRRGDMAVDTRVAPVIKHGEDLFGDGVEYYDLGISGLPEPKAVVGGVTPGYPAEAADLKPGDRITAIDGRPIDTWEDMRLAIEAGRGQALQITIQREDDRLTVEIAPKLSQSKNALGETEERYLIGISTSGVSLPAEELVVKRLNPWAALVESIERTYLVAELSIVGFGKMIGGSISRDNLGGPIMIVKMAEDQAREGIDRLIQFVALISINLAILNFLPIPVLDGGHLLFFAIEAVIRRPVSIRFREIAQQTGLLALLLLMVFVFYNDIMRYFIKSG
jgi:regulator of sigma E protease